MKIVGGILFVVGFFLLLAGLMAKSGTTDMATVGCLLMPGGLLLGYLLSPKKPQPQVVIHQAGSANGAPVSRLDTARDLIEESNYDAARALLRTIDDPKAREWLAKVDKLDPPTK